MRAAENGQWTMPFCRLNAKWCRVFSYLHYYYDYFFLPIIIIRDYREFVQLMVISQRLWFARGLHPHFPPQRIVPHIIVNHVNNKQKCLLNLLFPGHNYYVKYTYIECIWTNGDLFTHITFTLHERAAAKAKSTLALCDVKHIPHRNNTRNPGQTWSRLHALRSRVPLFRYTSAPPSI